MDTYIIMDKLVSIILPTYNGANRIKTAINSVLNQSYSDWELLVLDDGSIDNTEQIVTDFVKRDSRIIHLKNSENLGIQKSLNRGLRDAKGKYVARIDDDDEWIDKDKLKKQVDFFENNKDYVLLGTGLIAINDFGQEVFKKLNLQTDLTIRENILNKNCFTHSSVMFLRESALKFNGYDESTETRHVEDYDLWLKLGTIGKFANLPIYGIRLSLRNQSISSQNKILQFRRSIEIIKKYKNKYPNYYRAFISLYIRMNLYKLFSYGFLRLFYNFLYKIYKKTKSI